jgi:predicted dehydrogenase/threonine dehydrogenase-like Zn-dependent dehydrogenase
MKQLIQSYKTGELGLYDVPVPYCYSGGAIVRTTCSLVSAGTEKMIVDIAKKSLIGKAKARPDLVRQVVDKMKKEGIKNTLEKVFNKLDTPIPLGYSCAGVVCEVGEYVDGISAGDRVACGGAGYASHSEYNYVPKNLFVKIPDGVDDVDASFVTVGAIALQGVRQAEPTLGERVAVMGLGLLGQLTVQLLKANGCFVIGSDIDPKKLELAKKLGADVVCSASELVNATKEFGRGNGVDSVIITASANSNQLVFDAGEICKHKGKVVVVGQVGMDIPRNVYYKKELDLRLSMAYGPGRYDSDYEENGMDYPFAYVRWTERRNFEAFLDLVADGKITPKELITHSFEFDDAMSAYDLLEGKVKEEYLGIVLKYPNSENALQRSVKISAKNISANSVNIGLIGAGNFTKSVILPNIKKVKGFELVGLCSATGISAHSVGNKHGFAFATTDKKEIFASSEINAVVITTRHDDHAVSVIEALKAKKHCFVEKPLCIYEHELEEIKEAYEALEERPVLQVGFNRRFSPFAVSMKSELKGSVASVIYRVNAGIIPKESWIQDKGVGGGRVVGEVCHFVDMCSFLLSSEPVSVYARCVSSADASVPDEDNISITLGYANGSAATIVYCAYGNSQMPKEYIEVFANDLSMQMNDFRELKIFRGQKNKKFSNSSQDKGFEAEFEAFLKAVKSGISAISFESIYKTTKATFAALQSLKTGSVIEI